MPNAEREMAETPERQKDKSTREEMKGKPWETLIDVVAQGERDFNAGIGFDKGSSQYDGLKRKAWRFGWLQCWWHQMEREHGD